MGPQVYHVATTPITVTYTVRMLQVKKVQFMPIWDEFKLRLVMMILLCKPSGQIEYHTITYILF